MENLELYNAFREVPEEAQKKIGAGRLKGMTDINPMWRIKALTEQFGACGTGWYYEVLSQETHEAANEIVVVVNIKLYYKTEDGWSRGVYGTGGSKLVAQESKGAYVNDEAFKMALTDAISVAGKALGLGADIYWQKDNTKYNDAKKPAENIIDPNKPITASKVKILKELADKYKQNIADICRTYKINRLEDMTEGMYGQALTVFKGLEEGAKQ